MGEREVNICIIDSNKSFREGLIYFIQMNTSWKIISEFSSFHNFFDEQKSTKTPNIILMDFILPHVKRKSILNFFIMDNRHMKFIAITMYKDKLFLDDLIGAGFRGYINKRNIYEQLIPAVNCVLDGKFFFNDNLKLRKTGK